MGTMEKLFTQIKSEISQGDLTNEAVSKSGVFWHLDHALLVVGGICKALQKSNPAEYEYQFNKNRALLFPFGKLPRGVGRAPKVVVPESKVIEAQKLQEHLERCKKAWSQLSQLPAKAWFKHPVFSNLNLRRSKRFLLIHTRHHLMIIKDIRKSR
jgi:hypothetical protein